MFSFKPDDVALVLFEEMKGKERVFKGDIHSRLAPGPNRWDRPSPLKSLSPFFSLFSPIARNQTCMSGIHMIPNIPHQSARDMVCDPATVTVCQGSSRSPWACIPPTSIARNHTCMSGPNMIPVIPRQSARVMTRDPATVPVCEGSSRSPWACILFASISRNHTCMSGPHMILAHQRELWCVTQRPCLYVRVHNDHHGLAFHLLQSQEIIPV